MIKTFILILTFFLFLCSISYSKQNKLSYFQDKDSTLNEATSDNLPIFDIHLGAGLVSGGRIGIRALFLENFSVEFSYGVKIASFLSATNRNKIYGFGINWHKNNSNLVISLLTAIRKEIDQGTNYYYISPNIGWITFKSGGLHTFIRFGVAMNFSNNNSDNSILIGFTPNLDVGISFVLD